MEKIKVNISSSVMQILKKDMELFKFYKSDDELNTNLFINTLISNYYNIIEDEESSTISDLKKIIKNETLLNNDDIQIICEKISDYFLMKQFKDEAFDTSISFKPTNVSKDAFDNIIVSLNNKGISKYFRILFSNYSIKPQYIRERIIFKDTYEKIIKAIKAKKAISLKTSNNRDTYFPYKILHSGEELFNYLICYKNNNELLSIKLTNIKDLVITKDSFEISNEIKEKLDNIIKLGPQFACDTDKITEYAVKLTPDGIKKFRRIYIHRPKLDHKENDIYYFKCSYDQIYQYFFRFGKDAYVIFPNNLSKRLRAEYKEASNHYYEEYNLTKNS